MLAKLQAFFFNKLKDELFLFFFLKRPSIRNSNLISKLENYYFQYAFGLVGVDSKFPTPRFQQALVARDIFCIFKNKSKFSYCECCPLDGYISWRLSQMTNIELYAIEYLSKNIEKIRIISQIFSYKINLFRGCVESFNQTSFDAFTMLGCTYQMKFPLYNISYVYNNLLKSGSTFYVDMIHPHDSFSREDYIPSGITNEEGYEGLKFVYDTNHINFTDNFKTNHPIEFSETILYIQCVFLKYCKESLSVPKVIGGTKGSGFDFVTYRFSKE